jgi:ADP-ribose pyrophosphatase YjhB (NUDIX family)
MKQLHETQIQILKKLLFSNGLRFTEMKPEKSMDNNKFDFHLDQLVNEGFIEKKDSIYSLTNSGKEYANRMDTQRNTIPKQAKVSVFVGFMRKSESENEFLIYTRLKQPFYGAQGFISGKVKFGEKIVEAARRETKEETNLEGNLELIAIKHFLVKDEAENLVEDKVMFLYRMLNPIGELISNEEGKCEWVRESELSSRITSCFEPMDEFMRNVDLVKNFDRDLKLFEIEQVAENF